MLKRSQGLAMVLASFVVLASLSWAGATLLLDNSGRGRSGLGIGMPANRGLAAAVPPGQAPGQPGQPGQPGHNADAVLNDADRMLRLAPALDAERETLNDLMRQANAIMARIDHLQERQGEYGRALAEIDGGAETVASVDETVVPAPTDTKPTGAKPTKASPPVEAAMAATGSIPAVPVPDALPPPPPPPAAAYREASAATPLPLPPAGRASPSVAPGGRGIARQGVPAASPEPVASATQRRCQMITLLVQLGEEPTNADRRFLRQGCR